MKNMVIAQFKEGEITAKVTGLWQWNYGQVLRIQGLSLPTAVEIDFALQDKGGESVARIGVTKDGVTDVVIPDSMFENPDAYGKSYYIYAFIYLTDETSGHTEYEIKLSVETRSKPEAFDRPEDAEIFREAIAAVNEAADRAEESAKKEVTDGRIDEAVTEYLDENGIKTDKTLTVDGGIADAKATGDKIAKKADKENPVFTGSISLGRHEDTEVGGNSAVIGHFGTASGDVSLAEGAYTEAIGDYSHAEGLQSTASGDCSHAEGYGSVANGYISHAEGLQSTASGDCSHAEGYGSVANGYVSHAEGYSVNSGEYTHTEGYYTKASGDHQHVQGKYNIEDTKNKYAHIVGNGDSENARSNAHTLDWEGNAWYSGKLSQEGIPKEDKDLTTKKYVDDRFNNSVFTGSISMGRKKRSDIGANSIALGLNNTASGDYSHAEGWETTASGTCSHAEGLETTASGGYSHVQGKHNIKDEGNIYAHIVGNGTGNASRSNSHTLDWEGNAWYQGSVTSNGADYAEFFEWEDGNPDNEDRIGLFVCLNNGKIRLANSGEFPIGIVSGTAAVLGDNYECEWNGKYLTDDFGRIIYDEVEEFVDVITGIDEETNEPITKKKSLGIFKHPRINPDYDPEKEYINRAERPEWDTVGMLGKLYLRDDGTSVVNGYVTAGENGIGTASRENTNMRVLSRVSENVIRVMLK